MNKMIKTKLPVALENCPIVGSVVEIWFTSDLFPQTVVGIVHNKLKGSYPKVEQLLQLPQNLVVADPNLKYRAHFRLVGKSFALQVGPNVLNISPIGVYPGWSKFMPEIEEVLDAIKDLGLVKEVKRLGIRYTNFFNGNHIFKKLNLNIQLNGDAIPYANTILRTELAINQFTATLQVSNNANRVDPGKPTQTGSVVDIDLFKMYTNTKLSAVLPDISVGHELEKEVFWGLLSDELKDELKPTF